jgi:hypothetical protein
MPVRDWKFRIADILEAIQDSFKRRKAAPGAHPIYGCIVNEE